MLEDARVGHYFPTKFTLAQEILVKTDKVGLYQIIKIHIARKTIVTVKWQ
jgi:hypothetical protein